MKRVLTMLLALLVVVGWSGTARAHSDLVSSDPADGAKLSAAPANVTLEFSEPLLPDFVKVVATDDKGQTGELIVSAVTGGTAVIAWPQNAPGGKWRVEWRIVAEDGHPGDGSIEFSYPATSPSSASPTGSSTSAPPTPSPTPTSVLPTPTPSASTVTPQPTSSGVPGTWLIAVGALVLVAVATAVVLAVRRRPDA